MSIEFNGQGWPVYTKSEDDGLITIEREEYMELRREYRACRLKSKSLIDHLIRAREKGFYDFENVDYGGDDDEIVD